MIRKILSAYIVQITTTLLLFSSCSTFNGTPLEGYLGADQNLIDLAYTIAEDLEKQAFPPIIPRHPDRPILTTTFVNNNDLGETSHFSRILQEHLTSKFVQMGYTVREIKLRNELHIEPGNGETMLSRNLQNINKTQTAQAISVGTYSFTGRTMYISARLIDPESANILSSADYKIVMDKNVLAMFGLELRQDEEMNLIEEPKQSFMTWLLY